MKKLLLPFLMAILAALLLAACGSDSGAGTEKEEGGSTGGSEGAGEVTEYKIGAIYSKTGPNSPLGEPEWNATKLIEEKINAEGGINGVPLKIILADDESSQEKATQEANRLINDEKVIAILGSSGSGESLAMKGIAMQQQVPMVSAAASAHVVEPVEDSKWVFKTPQSDKLAVERVYMYLNEQGIGKVGLITDSNAFGSSGLEYLEALDQDYDIEIVAKESFNTQDPDMSAQLTKINSAGAEAIIVWGTNPGPAVIAKNTRDLGIDLPIIGSHGIANQNFITLAEAAAEGVVIPTGKLLFPSEIPADDPQYDVISTFYEEYTAKYSSEPTNFGSYGYDNIMLVIEALKNGATDRESIRDYLETNINDWVGTTGVFNFTAEDHNGLTPDSLVMAVVKDGKWTFLE
ncbi:ABC-type branched-chain amino acid transport systems, periplasmic component [Bacillus sp. OxB-1]|uniref:ABC transporter substrate-binding protein n=1 Tax=Bacillus sp. (strain OxB-1) TaxID=98228 RepID=UPI00058234A1|nr:ABC transporter substrate-binding protein [Bacillus sp. OxB-1]BAQ09661.1 ABC-type branched-chain amino acid transport systems, periplasmic component [Bacillus sp. OxB-1]